MGQAGDPSTGAFSLHPPQTRLNQYKAYLQDGATITTSPHKLYGP
jgi:hypothetical protein